MLDYMTTVPLNSPYQFHAGWLQRCKHIIYKQLVTSRVMYVTTVNRESFTGLNFCSFHNFSKKHKSFSYKPFALSINIFCFLALYCETITAKIHVLWILRSLAQQKFPCLRYMPSIDDFPKHIAKYCISTHSYKFIVFCY